MATTAELRDELQVASAKLSTAESELTKLLPREEKSPIAVGKVRQKVEELRASQTFLKRRLFDLEETDAAAIRQAERDEQAFWFRRFFTSLAIGHAGAFFAIATGVFQSDNLQRAAQMAFWPVVFFGTGLVLAGATPLFLWLERSAKDTQEHIAFRRASSLSAYWSGAAFAIGILLVLRAFWLASR